MLLWACSGAPADAPVTVDEPPAPSREEALALLPEPVDEAVDDTPVSGEPVELEITWDGIGRLYKSFFQDREAVTELAVRLGPHVVAPAQLIVRYDSEDFLGDIRLRVPPNGLKAPPSELDGVVELSELVPVLRALAVYRDTVASRFDIRVQSFRIGIEGFRGPRHCLAVPAGQPPPDGRTVSPCVVVNGRDVCGRPEGTSTHFTSADFDAVAGCFR